MNITQIKYTPVNSCLKAFSKKIYNSDFPKDLNKSEHG